jgi:hypothetical protein
MWTIRRETLNSPNLRDVGAHDFFGECAWRPIDPGQSQEAHNNRKIYIELVAHRRRSPNAHQINGDARSGSCG